MTSSLTLLVDAATLYFRAYFGVPKTLTDQQGRPVNALHGMLDMLTRLIGQYSPTALVCCWDDDWRPAWRVDLVPSYKAHRVAEPAAVAASPQSAAFPGTEIVDEELAQQVPWIADVLAALGLCRVGAADHEADDVAGTLARQLAAAGEQAIVVSGDRDLFQLVGERVRVAYIARGVARHELVDDQWLLGRLGITGAQYADFATLRGDSSDGLPGVPGIGEKTAANLLNTHGDLDGVLAAAQDPASAMPARQRQRLLEATDYLARARVVVATAQVELPQLDMALRPGRADLVRCAELADRHNCRGPVGRLLSALGEPHLPEVGDN